MATTGPQFPPGVMQLNSTTWSALNQTGSSGPFPFFTAPTSGLYLVAGAVHLVSTNNAGTLSVQISSPHNGPSFTVINPNIAAGTDGAGIHRPTWLNAGESLTQTTIAAGLTATTFNTSISVLKVL